MKWDENHPEGAKITASQVLREGPAIARQMGLAGPDGLPDMEKLGKFLMEEDAEMFELGLALQELKGLGLLGDQTVDEALMEMSGNMLPMVEREIVTVESPQGSLRMRLPLSPSPEQLHLARQLMTSRRRLLVLDRPDMIWVSRMLSFVMRYHVRNTLETHQRQGSPLLSSKPRLYLYAWVNQLTIERDVVTVTCLPRSFSSLWPEASSFVSAFLQFLERTSWFLDVAYASVSLLFVPWCFAEYSKTIHLGCVSYDGRNMTTRMVDPSLCVIKIQDMQPAMPGSDSPATPPTMTFGREPTGVSRPEKLAIILTKSFSSRLSC